MSKQFPGTFRRLIPRLSPVVGWIAVVSGCLVLTGWTANIEGLKRNFLGIVSMNPLSAVAFIFAGASLLGHLRSGDHRRDYWPHLLAGVVLLIASVRLTGYFMSWEDGPDQWLFTNKLENDLVSVPNRMAPNTALSFFFLGGGLVLMDWATPKGRRPTEFCAWVVGFISLLALLGYAYQVTWLYGLVSFIPMAFNTAVILHLMAFGLLCARPHNGGMALVTGNGPGGALIRHLFPVVIPGLMLLGWVRLKGEHQHWFSAEMGTTLYTIVAILMVGGMLWWCARSLDRAEKARRQVEEDLERFFTLSLDLLCIVGLDGYIKRINPAFSEVLGYSLEDLTSRPFMSFVHPDDMQATRAEMRRVIAGELSDQFQNRYLCKDGTCRWFWWKAQPLQKEGLIYATARDVTEQKKAQEEIRLLNANLQERAVQLDSSNQELEAFSYSVSHDLRAPLRGISGFTQALEAHSKEVLDDTARGYLARVRRASERMGMLIDDLLKLSRLTRAEMMIEPVDLSAQAEAILAQLHQRDPHRQVRVQVASGIVMKGDAALLRILMENLLENAWKFTSKNPDSQIEVGMLTPEPDAPLACYVRDDGVGFDMRYATKLFGAFQRLHSMVEFPGTGIGLATVQRIVRRHGGRVWAEAQVNEGSTFYFTV